MSGQEKTDDGALSRPVRDELVDDFDEEQGCAPRSCSAGAGGIGFQLPTAMNLFQYPTVSPLLIMTFVLMMAAERGSAILRRPVA